jgi:hypothetical protein
MAQPDRQSARSATMQESATERIRIVPAEGSGEQARVFVLRAAEALPLRVLLEIELDFDPRDPGDPDEPGDLLGTLAASGVLAQARQTARGAWSLLLQRAGSPPLMDLSDLEAPLPLETILEAAAALEPGECLFARTPCYPHPLLSMLDRRGLDWQAAETRDANGLVFAGRPD